MFMLVITLLGMLAAWIAAYVAWEGVAESRINSAVNCYVDLVERSRDSGISALLKSNVADMQERHLQRTIARIEMATGKNPLGKDIQETLELKRVPIGRFLSAVANRKSAPPTLDLTQIIESLKL